MSAAVAKPRNPRASHSLCKHKQALDDQRRNHTVLDKQREYSKDSASKIYVPKINDGLKR